MSKDTTPPIPQITPPVSFTGALTFPCCGSVHTVKGESLDLVICPMCRISYSLHLNARYPAGEKWSKGTVLILQKDLETQVGSSKVTLKKGQKLRAGSDPYGVLGTNEDVTLVEIESPAAAAYGKKQRVLLAPVPNELLELEIKDGEGQGEGHTGLKD